MSDCKQTPLLNLLRSVPLDARLSYKHSPTDYSMIPAGRLCNEAADEIERLRAALTELVACHTESAGWTVEMLSNRAEFDAMLNRSQERVESAVGAARAALKEKP